MPISKTAFKRMTAYEKGVAVYMLGARKDEPNIPRNYKPSERERTNYEHGQAVAVQVVQDDP